MPFSRLPTRDPRTIARDIPGVLDVLFPRLTGGLIKSLNAKTFAFPGIRSIPDELIDGSRLQNAMLFEISMVRAESELRGDAISWEKSLEIASCRQRRYFDAKIPDHFEHNDMLAIDFACRNVTAMLRLVSADRENEDLEFAPEIPGLGWIASGNGDFAIGSTLIEVKHTDRSFGSNDLRQVLMYWMLRYASLVEGKSEAWSNVLLLNPRKNRALSIDFEYLLRSASASSNRVELVELLRFVVGQESDRR